MLSHGTEKQKINVQNLVRVRGMRNAQYVKGLKGEAGLNLWYRKARRRNSALIRLVDTGLRLVSRSNFRCRGGGHLDLSRWTRCAHTTRTRHAYVRTRTWFFKAERGGSIKRREEIEKKTGGERERERGEEKEKQRGEEKEREGE